MKNFRVKLNAVEIPFTILDYGELGVLGRADGGIAGRQGDEAVAV